LLYKAKRLLNTECGTMTLHISEEECDDFTSFKIITSLDLLNTQNLSQLSVPIKINNFYF